METTFYSLATKSKFNKSLNHFYAVNDAVDMIEDDVNLADYIDEELDNDELLKDQILPIVSAVVKDKFDYSYDSFTIPKSVKDFTNIVKTTSKWTGIDIIMIYYNPNLEIFIINPKNQDIWEKVGELSKDHLVVIYAKHLKSESNKNVEQAAIKAMQMLIAGKGVKPTKAFVDPSRRQKKPPKREESVSAISLSGPSEPSPAPSPAAPAPGAAPAAAQAPAAKAPAAAPAAGGKKRSTPKYSVLVTNELFHNGNVEAWKKIVESYETKYPDLKISVFYDDELINDLNSLFKWGKVKHNSNIYFQVTGVNILGVSKLQKYFFEGASNRFEQFLKFGVGKVLNLF